MKKYLSILAVAVLMAPSVALASWWNPLSWNVFHNKESKTTPIITKTNLPSVSATATPSKENKKIYSVVKVVDGDTLDVLIEGKVERLRLIGINTPETVDPRKPVECFGVEASNKAKTILSGKRVSLESDDTQGERDKYSRLLRYVFLEDGTNFNLLMIKEGYAYEYTYSLPYKYQSEFKAAQKSAETNKKGLWASGVCEKEVKTTTTPAPIVIPTPTPIQTSSQCNPNYSGCLKSNAGDYDCAGGTGNGPNYTGAVQVIGYDEYGLDRDGDGWACER